MFLKNHRKKKMLISVTKLDNAGQNTSILDHLYLILFALIFGSNLIGYEFCLFLNKIPIIRNKIQFSFIYGKNLERIIHFHERDSNSIIIRKKLNKEH